MSSRNIWNASLAVGAALLLGAALSAAPAEANAASEADNAAAKTLTGIQADARSVHASAMELNRMATENNLAWKAADTKWNEIMPSVEAMQIKAAHLEGMKLPASSPEAITLAQAKPLIWKIRTTTDELHKVLNQGNPLDKVAVQSYAESLVQDSAKLAGMVGPAES